MQREVEVEVAIIGRTAYVCMFAVYMCVYLTTCAREGFAPQNTSKKQLNSKEPALVNSIQFKSRFLFYCCLSSSLPFSFFLFCLFRSSLLFFCLLFFVCRIFHAVQNSPKTLSNFSLFEGK